MSDLCSVLCVSYNHAKFAAAGLQSIFEQTYRSIEIIVLDDGSSDRSVEVIEVALGQSPFPTKFIKQENSGNVPANFNKVLAEAAGEFVAVMSLDDLLMPDCIMNAVQVLSTDPNMVFSANTGFVEIDENGNQISSVLHRPLPKSLPKTAEDLIELEYNYLGTFFVQGQVFRRNALWAAGGWDDKMTGDDIIVRTRLFQHMARNPKLRFSLGNQVVFSYRKHESNIHKNVFRQIKTIIEWKTKYFPDRVYPDLFYRWLKHFTVDSIRRDMHENLQLASNLCPEVATFIQEYKASWNCRLRIMKVKTKELFRGRGL